MNGSTGKERQIRKPLLTIAVLFMLMRGLATPSHAAQDLLERGMQLYKQHRYEDALRVLKTYLPSADSSRQAKTYLGLGMNCLASASLHQELYQSAITIHLDYLTRLLNVNGPGQSHWANLYLGHTLLAAGKISQAAASYHKFLADKTLDSTDQDLAKIGVGVAMFLQNQPDKAQELWSTIAPSTPELSAALAAVFSQMGLAAQEPLARCQHAYERVQRSGGRPSIHLATNLLGVYARQGNIDEGLALLTQVDLGAFFHEEIPIKNKAIRFYDPALLGNLALFYATAAMHCIEKAHTSEDENVNSLALYYLGQGYGLFGDPDQSMRMLNAFISAPNSPPELKSRAKVRQAFNHYLLGNQEAASDQLNALLQLTPDSNMIAEMLLLCIRYKFEAPHVFRQAVEMAQRGQGQQFAKVNFALGKYHLWKKNYLQALAYMEAGRDKSKKIDWSLMILLCW